MRRTGKKSGKTKREEDIFELWLKVLTSVINHLGYANGVALKPVKEMCWLTDCQMFIIFQRKSSYSANMPGLCKYEYYCLEGSTYTSCYYFLVTMCFSLCSRFSGFMYHLASLFLFLHIVCFIVILIVNLLPAPRVKDKAK